MRIEISEIPTEEELEKMLCDFENNYKPQIEEWGETVSTLIEDFVKDFPIDEMGSLPMEKYILNTNYSGTRNTFCGRLFDEVKNSSMTECRPDFWGLYYDGYEVKRNKTIENLELGSVQKEYFWLRDRIVELLEAGEKYNIKSIAESKVNSYVRNKILSVYFPDRYLPMNSQKYVNNVCLALGLDYDEKEEVIYKTEQIKKWKDSHKYSKDWSNYMFMRFCDTYFWKKEFKTKDYKATKINNLSERMVFFKVARMKYYQGTNQDKPIGSGKWISEHEWGYEIYNFKPVKTDSGEVCYGFVEPGLNGGKHNQIRLENIVGCETFKDEDYVDDVLVIFAMPADMGGYVILGWYNHATIYRYCTKQRPDVETEMQYNVVANRADCVLMPVSERNRDSGRYWDLPLGKGKSGRSHIWYANYNKLEDDETENEVINYRKQIYEKILNYTGENILDSDVNKLKNLEKADVFKYINTEREEEDKKDANYLLKIEKALLDYDFEPAKYNPEPEPIEYVAVLNGKKDYKRDPKRALNALVRANFTCEVEAEHPTFIRKSNGTPYTEAHHLIPMSRQGEFKNRVDVEANIVSLCCNCHAMIHKGENPGVLLERLFEKRKEQLEMAGIKTTYEQLLRMYR